MDNMLNRSAQTSLPNIRKRRPVFPQKPVNWSKPTHLPPLFLKTYSEVGEEGDEFSPKEINLPKEARLIFFLMLLIIYTLYTYVQICSLAWVTCGSAEQPLQDPGDKAQNQPMPHPSDKIV